MDREKALSSVLFKAASVFSLKETGQRLFNRTMYKPVRPTLETFSEGSVDYSNETSRPRSQTSYHF